MTDDTLKALEELRQYVFNNQVREAFPEILAMLDQLIDRESDDQEQPHE